MLTYNNSRKDHTPPFLLIVITYYTKRIREESINLQKKLDFVDE